MRFIQALINLFQFNRTNWKAVALCFMAAAIFWLFNSFNKTYSANITFPLHFEYDRDHYVEMNPLPGHLQINVSGNGWDLFRKNLGLRLPELTIPIERPAEMKRMVAATLVPMLAGQLSGLQINFVVADTLRIQLDEKYSRTFKLSADLSAISFHEGWGITGPVVIVPDTVQMTGAKSVLLQWPDTLHLSLPAVVLRDSFNEDVEVPLAETELIKRNPPVVNVRIPVGRVTIQSFPVKLLARNLPSGKVLVTDSLSIRVQVPEAFDIKQLDKVTATIDLRHLSKGKHRLLPRIHNLPSYLQVKAVDSVQVIIN
jgi:hypothetical protein